jgi:phosphoglycolate phosphatase
MSFQQHSCPDRPSPHHGPNLLDRFLQRFRPNRFSDVRLWRSECREPIPLCVTSADSPVPARGVVFDIDGTLATASSTHLQALGDTAEHLLGVPAVFTMHGERPHLNGELVAGWVDGQCFELLSAQAGLEWDLMRAATLRFYAERYTELLRQGAPAGELVAGVPVLLDTLAAHGIAMGLSTGNTSKVAAAKLGALGVAHHFTFAAEAGFGDVHSHREQVARAAAAALGPVKTIYLVGDTTADMRAAVAAGASGVGVCTGADGAPLLLEAGASTVLADVSELLGWFGLGTSRWIPRHVPGVVSAADLWMDYR